MPPRLRSLARWFATHGPLVVMLGLVAAIYFPVTRIYFVADDFSNMLTILDEGPLHFVLEPFGGHMLMVRNVAYWLHFELFGFEPDGYGWVAFLTHLLNVWLVYRVAKGFGGDASMGALAALLYGSSPLLEGAVGWYSVYGHVLSGTALLVVLDRMAAWRVEDGPLRRREVIAWLVVLVAGAASFGVGIAIAITFPVVAVVMLPRVAWTRATVALVFSLPVIVVGVYVGSRWLYGLFYPMPAAEAFMQGVATSRIAPIFTLLGHLCAVGAIALVESFWYAPSAYPGSATVPVLVVVGLLSIGVWRSRAEGKRRIAGLLLLSVAVYAFISLGRANVYVMFQVPLAEAGKTLRYHYAPLIPFSLALCLSLGPALRWVTRRSEAPAILFATVTALVAVAHGTSGWRPDEHTAARAYVRQVLAIIDSTIDAVPAGQEVVIQNRPLPLLITGPALAYQDIPGWAGLFMLADDDGLVRGRRVRFTQTRDQEIEYRPRNPHLRQYLAPAGTPNAR